MESFLAKSETGEGKQSVTSELKVADQSFYFFFQKFQIQREANRKHFHELQMQAHQTLRFIQKGCVSEKFKQETKNAYEHKKNLTDPTYQEFH